MTPKILIVDDHEIVREGIRTLIRRSRPDWVIAGEATDGLQAIDAVKSLNPDIVILDITMPGMNGLAAATQISKLDLPVRVLMFTMHDLDRLADEARNVGAHGYVLKSQASRDLIRAIDQLLSGGTFFGGPAPAPAPERNKDLGATRTSPGTLTPADSDSEPNKLRRAGFGFRFPIPTFCLHYSY